MGKSAAIRLVKMNYLSDEEAETFSSLLANMSPRTLNGAALALVYTTYDPHTRTFLEEVDPKASGEMKAYQKKRCWSTLVKNLKGDDLQSFVHDYGITAPDLLRYFFFLKKTLEKTSVYSSITEATEQDDDEEKEETFY
jgi:hypothetical protein